ncbi:hypothetical protein BGZ88_003491, partial [Linnemannia elongata]
LASQPPPGLVDPTTVFLVPTGVVPVLFTEIDTTLCTANAPSFDDALFGRHRKGNEACTSIQELSKTIKERWLSCFDACNAQAAQEGQKQDFEEKLDTGHVDKAGGSVDWLVAVMGVPLK